MSECVWEQTLEELRAWKPIEPKPELALRTISKKVTQSQERLRLALQVPAPPRYDMYRRRAKATADLMEDVEMRLKNILAGITPPAAATTSTGGEPR